MPRAGAWIALLAVGQLAGCSSTLTQISPTQPSGEPSGRLGPFLNSPFVLTVVGGLAVAGITSGYSYLKASHDEKLAKDNCKRAANCCTLVGHERPAELCLDNRIPTELQRVA